MGLISLGRAKVYDECAGCGKLVFVQKGQTDFVSTTLNPFYNQEFMCEKCYKDYLKELFVDV
jgi:hypothetical protein